MAKIITTLEQAFDLFNLPENVVEEWRDIKDYEGLYQISSLGRVKSLQRYVYHETQNHKALRRERILKTRLGERGYFYMSLCKNAKIKTFKVHRLVAFAFHDNPENKPTVNHKNGIKTDNRAINLEWATYSENQIHAFKTGLQKQKAALSREQALEVQSKFIPYKHTRIKLALEYNVSLSTIKSVLGGNYNWTQNT